MTTIRLAIVARLGLRDSILDGELTNSDAILPRSSGKES